MEETLQDKELPSAPKPAKTEWETMLRQHEFVLERRGRYIKASLLCPHLVLSTSVVRGGMQTGLCYLVNHQSCEGKDHREIHELHKSLGLEGYHRLVCGDLAIDPEETAAMGTAANMNYASMMVREDEDVKVTAVVTAGVQGNAACAGDPANWRERAGGSWEKVNPNSGTINTMLFINKPVTEGALARAAITMVEAKSAALTRLAIGSLYSAELATGTGTDQFCIAVPSAGDYAFTSTSPHVKLGELIGTAVRDATMEALRWQNGLEPSHTRSIFHALGRFGLTEPVLYELIAAHLSERAFELLKLNHKSVFYEPLASAAAYAMATVLDRVRHGTVPESVAREAMRHQGACVAVALSAKPDQWLTFRNDLPEPEIVRPLPFIAAAIAAGWALKWT
jgi:adenosylcobinamide amidohydrolase